MSYLALKDDFGELGTKMKNSSDKMTYQEALSYMNEHYRFDWAVTYRIMGHRIVCTILLRQTMDEEICVVPREGVSDRVHDWKNMPESERAFVNAVETFMIE